MTVNRGSHGALSEAELHDRNFRRLLLQFIRTGDRSDLPTEVTLPEPYWTVPK